jgi:hypothetical protein
MPGRRRDGKSNPFIPLVSLQLHTWGPVLFSVVGDTFESTCHFQMTLAEDDSTAAGQTGNNQLVSLSTQQDTEATACLQNFSVYARALLGQASSPGSFVD